MFYSAVSLTPQINQYKRFEKERNIYRVAEWAQLAVNHGKNCPDYPTYILNFLNYTLLKVSKNLFSSGFVRKLYRAGYYPANPSNNYLKLRKYFLNGFSRAST